jgi:hypothetical protein
LHTSCECWQSANRTTLKLKLLLINISLNYAAAPPIAAFDNYVLGVKIS